ncbi:ATP synthase F1 subunit delta [Patescibacteria group bacterium]|nr:ATP synthase F1 subunit delta [Patescibacteria group bacterium]MBU1663482.1 ATP synthase F1 subunit delta [Patescibacteria group bacterium]MBU1933727.1 ATP synthase F1 subunit delta [Patescibacteria group bacterium]MBU2007673.1 ATP synthase F1 subunit delta [Patescibacteria group bacterium]MBU2233615.1 ATP synthase F1 subunit delta [Patescibacteria group bacterium]
MKITVKQFALSLYEAIDGKTSSQAKVVIEKFVELLAEKNQLAKANKIIEEFIKLWNNKHGIVQAEVASANELNEETVKLLKNYIAKLYNAKQVIISEKIDKKLLGGVIIKYEDKVVDGSLKARLVELKNKMIK